MKVTLVFSPFMVPTYLPLGIAQLKSYIESRSPEVTVKTIDLNHRLFQGLGRRDFVEQCKTICHICPQGGRCSLKEHLDHAWRRYRIGVECLTDSRRSEFWDSPKYNFLIDAFSFFLDHWKDRILGLGKEFLEAQRPLAPFLRKLLKDDLHCLQAEKPDLIGFSILVESQLVYSLLLSKLLRRAVKTPIVFGGAYMSYIDPAALLETFPFVDWVIDQEGEAGLESLIRSLGNSKAGPAAGVYYRSNGQVLKTPVHYLETLDLLPPPDFSDFDLGRYFFPQPVLPVKFSRGCYWQKCTFCNYRRAYPRPYREKSLPEVIEEIEGHTAQNIRHFNMVDDAVSSERLVSFSRALRAKGLEIFFSAVVRPERGFSAQALKTIYGAGGRALIWGVESSSQRILNLMKKGTRIKEIREILQTAHQLGFLNHVFMIRGFPTQTEAEIYADAEFLANNRESIHYFGIHDFGIGKGSYIYHHPERFGVRWMKEIPLLRGRKGDQAIYGNHVSFQLETKLNWKRIRKGQARMLNPFWEPVEGKPAIRSYDHAHMLLHACGLGRGNEVYSRAGRTGH